MIYKTIADATKDGWIEVKKINNFTSLYKRDDEIMFDYELLNASPLPLMVFSEIGKPGYYKDAHSVAISLLGRDITKCRVWINVPILNPEFSQIEKRIEEVLEKLK